MNRWEKLIVLYWLMAIGVLVALIIWHPGLP